MNLRPLIEASSAIIARSCVDSELATTRIFWRRKLGFPEAVVNSPLAIGAALAEYEEASKA